MYHSCGTAADLPNTGVIDQDLILYLFKYTSCGGCKRNSINFLGKSDELGICLPWKSDKFN